MSWLGIEETEDDDKGLPNGYDLLPSLGERDEAPIPSPHTSRPTDKEIDKLLAEVKPAPSAMTVDALIGQPAVPDDAPLHARLPRVWPGWRHGASGETIDSLVPKVEKPLPRTAKKAQAVEPVEQPPAADPYEVRALDALSDQVEQLTAKVEVLNRQAAERTEWKADNMEPAGEVEIVKNADTGLMSEVRWSDGLVGKIIRDETLGVLRVEYFRPKK